MFMAGVTIPLPIATSRSFFVGSTTAPLGITMRLGLNTMTMHSFIMIVIAMAVIVIAAKTFSQGSSGNISASRSRTPGVFSQTNPSAYAQPIRFPIMASLAITWSRKASDAIYVAGSFELGS